MSFYFSSLFYHSIKLCPIPIEHNSGISNWPPYLHKLLMPLYRNGGSHKTIDPFLPLGKTVALLLLKEYENMRNAAG